MCLVEEGSFLLATTLKSIGKVNQTSAGVALSNQYSLSPKPFNNTIEYPEAPIFKMVDNI